MTVKLPSVACAATVFICSVVLLAPRSVFGQSATTAAASRPAAKRLLIVAPKEFHGALTAFVRHKRQHQLATDLVSLEAVLKVSQGVDDPERLKRFLHAQWRERGLDYVLLVGDADVMPVRFFVFDRKVPPSFNYGFCPSDLYYADLAKADGSFEDWNQQKASFHAGYFGEVRGEYNKSDPINFDGIDMLPDVAVGRWPVSTPEQVLTVAKKSIRYELAAAGDDEGVRRAGAVCTAGWIDGRPALDRFVDRLSGIGWTGEKRYYSDAKRNDRTPPPNETEIYKLMNQRLGLLAHVGHGGTQDWAGCLAVKHLDRVQNSGWLPVAISVGCSTADFVNPGPYVPYVDVDGRAHPGTNHKEVFTAPPPPPSPYQKGKYLPQCLGKQILRAGPSGAVAYIGSSTGAQPCAMTLLEGFSLALEKHQHPRLGDCWNDAVRHYHKKERLEQLKPTDSWYPPAIFHQPMKFVLLGDPSLQMPRAAAPSAKREP